MDKKLLTKINDQAKERMIESCNTPDKAIQALLELKMTNSQLIKEAIEEQIELHNKIIDEISIN